MVWNLSLELVSLKGSLKTWSAHVNHSASVTVAIMVKFDHWLHLNSPPTTSEWPQVSSAVRCRTARHSRCREVSLSRGRVNSEAEIAGWRSPRYQPCLLPSVDSTPGGAVDVDSSLSPLIPPPVSPAHSFEFGDRKLRSKDSTCLISYMIDRQLEARRKFHFFARLMRTAHTIAAPTLWRWKKHFQLTIAYVVKVNRWC